MNWELETGDWVSRLFKKPGDAKTELVDFVGYCFVSGPVPGVFQDEAGLFVPPGNAPDIAVLKAAMGFVVHGL